MSEFFYRAVAQAILLYSPDTWVLSATMDKKSQVAQTGFLRNITGKRTWQIVDETWETIGARVVK